jgi:hypothetical protein
VSDHTPNGDYAHEPRPVPLPTPTPTQDPSPKGGQ